jgi:glycosyltransferase involved in cell wall biosynthesis
MVCALIPAYNESERITSTIEALASRGEIDTIVVVDDGSTDNTAEVARRAGADEVVVLAKNGGKGAALCAGYLAARDRADVFLLLDADLGRTATECVKLLAALEAEAADMVIGMLPADVTLDSAGSLGGGMGFVVRLARWGLRRKTGIDWRQPLSGQRAVRKSVIESISGRFASGFGVEVSLTLAAIKAGYKVVEVETAFRHRVTENDLSDLLHRGKQFIDVAKAIAAN